jgi:hypothetical protein
MVRKRNIAKVLGLVIIGAIVVFFLFFYGGMDVVSKSADENFIKCLNENNVKLYLVPGSPQYNAQKVLFGEKFEEMNIINCNLFREKCSVAIIYPTWEINGKIIYGGLSLEVLAKLSGCEL